MRKLFAILICLVCFSCSKKNEIEEVFLKSLKSTTKNYQNEIEDILEKLNTKYSESKKNYYKLQIEKLAQSEAEIKKSKKEWVFKQNDEIIKSQNNLIQKLNSLDAGIKYELLKNVDLNFLPKEILIQYIEENLYRTLLNNYKNSLKDDPGFCGYFKLSKKGIEDEIKYLEYEIEGLKEDLKKNHWD